ncbi:MAG: hypothetical protein JWN40_2442 [Phycisphaerales bacterium]|nr:hypothetical protein [Phycisphaerales bacterium]
MFHNFTHRPSIRFSLIAAAASLAISAMPASVYAQVPEDPALKEVENSKFSTSGVIMSNAVFVRCGPGDNYYPTLKLDKGAKVKVVGAKFDWLKVVPPDGSFCYVARLYVDRHGDGSVGRVNKDSINVRAGSALSALKIGILCELNQGEDVEILGEEQEYFKIKPPARAYLYINKKFVEPDPDAKPVVQVASADTKVNPPAVPDAANSKPPEAPTKPEAPANPDFAPAKPTIPEDAKTTDVPPTAPLVGDMPKPEVKPEVKPVDIKPADTGTPAPLVEPDAAPKGDGPRFDVPKPVVKPEAPVKPAPPKIDVSTPELAEAAYDKAETQFMASRTQALDQQPLEALVQQFEAISQSDALPESLRRLADSRLATVKLRAAAQADLIKARQSQSELKQKQLALEAEQQELQKRIAETTVKVYTAVGTLQPSSLQQGQGTLFRITDPATGRTVCYLRSNDAKTVTLIGQFVGVKGALQEEARLGARVITPTEVTACDPGKVHQTITARIIPPSLMPHEPAQATTDPQPQQ